MKKNTILLTSILLVSNITSCNVEEPIIDEEKKEEIVKVESVVLDYDNVTLEEGRVFRLEARVYPENATNKKLIWKVEVNGNVSPSITCKEGIIRGVKEGNNNVVVTSEDNPSAVAKCRFKVEAHDVSKYVIRKIDFTYSDYTENNYAPIDSCPTKTSSPKLLVIPIWFTDSGEYITKKEEVIEDIKQAFFGDTSEDEMWNSVKSFYKEESLNSCIFNGVVAPWYETDKGAIYYTSSELSKRLILKAVDNYFEKNTNEKKEDYDSDKDGYMDGVIAIYGAPNYQTAKNNNLSISKNTNLWAYCQWVQDRSIPNSSGKFTTAKANVYLWASYDFMYSKSNALERTGKNFYSGYSIDNSLDTHTYIHEMGHVLGLDDYYDYNNTCHPAGGFSMQDRNVGGHDPFSLMAFGWVYPYIPINTCEITISTFQNTNEVILLTPSFNKYSSAFDEYLLLEFYSPTRLNLLDTKYRYKDSYPIGVDDYGIRLWHVDARLTYYLNKNTENIIRWSENLVTSPKEITENNFGVNTAMSNTYYVSGYDEGNKATSVLGLEYTQYNLLELISKENSIVDKTINDVFISDYLFKEGDSFSMDEYKDQFIEAGKLNKIVNYKNVDLGYSFKVKKIDTEKEEATISITKTTVNN